MGARFLARLRVTRKPSYWPVFVLFVALRLMMLLTFPADNLTLYGDYLYYYELAALSDQGYLPFIHTWSEYPPVFPFLSVGLYRLSELAGGGYHVYVTLLGLVMLAVDTGNLALVLRVAQRLHGEEMAERTGWIYSVLFVPLIHLWWNFDALNAFALLLALELLLQGRDRWAALAMGGGALVKLLPVLVFPVLAKTRSWQRWLVGGLLVAAVIGAAAVGLLIAGGPVAVASFRSLTSRTSWQTVWALIDGNLRTGLLGAPAEHLDLSKATAPVGNPSRVPDLVRLLVFGAVYGLAFWKARLCEAPRRQVAFVAFTLVLFFLWSEGWSPQWQALLFPLLLLVLPLRRGILFIVVLSLVNLAEWPVLLSRGLNEWLYLTITLRTVLFIVLLVELGQVVWKRPASAS